MQKILLKTTLGVAISMATYLVVQACITFPGGEDVRYSLFDAKTVVK